MKGVKIIMVGRKLLWLIILMVWVGMVSSIVIYQGDVNLPFAKVTSKKTDVVESNSVNEQNTDNEQINYTEYDSGNEIDTENFFIEYRIERDKARSEQISIFREMVNNPNTDEATKKDVQNKMLDLTAKMEKEMEIESLIRARGFTDALAYIHDESVDVIIQTKEHLNKGEVAQIGDIIVKTTGLNFDDVTIIEKTANNK